MNRGVKDVSFVYVDGLPGFKEVIQVVYSQAEIQWCVIHMLRKKFPSNSNAVGRKQVKNNASCRIADGEYPKVDLLTN